VDHAAAAQLICGLTGGLVRRRTPLGRRPERYHLLLARVAAVSPPATNQRDVVSARSKLVHESRQKPATLHPAGFIRRRVVNIEKIRRMLRWSPRVTLEYRDQVGPIQPACGCGVDSVGFGRMRLSARCVWIQMLVVVQPGRITWLG
jgi:hypothetical protein